jgi:hypothetical protein
MGFVSILIKPMQNIQCFLLFVICKSNRFWQPVPDGAGIFLKTAIFQNQAGLKHRIKYMIAKSFI